MKWKDLASIAALAAQSRGVPYQVSGTVAIGGETLNVDLPFRLAGTITHEQLVTAIGNSLPGPAPPRPALSRAAAGLAGARPRTSPLALGRPRERLRSASARRWQASSASA